MIKISLTQFLDYSAKVSTSAKINKVKEIKRSPGYHPAFDYWKPLRDAIKKIHEQGQPIEKLRDVLINLDEKKIKNYTRAINTYISFVKKNNVEYFSVGKASWNMNDELFVSSSPELGLIINGKKYYVKNYYKKHDDKTKVVLKNINSTLTLMSLSEPNFDIEPDAKFAVINFQNGKLIEAKTPASDNVMELEIEAENFVNIWNKF
ncbi:hypothetical protein KF282_1225 [Lactococcus lactis subsp. lactis]|uniref:Uncharacterized protein n=1 Tax=Lactococcus lactis subsp. lactis TaxID=1360 RepID=A0A0V8CYC9_LACLL|nr:hypothetical protein [Lactococcus lactis]KSU06326.1 hypothetical protein KF282_1225 [Lactococcus lactis subsp. lactis]